MIPESREVTDMPAENPERHVYKPLHPSPNSAGIGVGPCQHPGCTEPANSTVHGALDLFGETP